MSTLTDRYVWGVLRAVPERQRAELEPEIRALIADAVDARLASGGPAEAAERAALVELGDPERLAARYTERPLHLIGPRYFLEYRRLLALLVSIVVPIIALVVAFGDTIAGRPVLDTLAHAASAAFAVGVQIAFWVTVAFAVAERTNVRGVPDTWTPDSLPELPGPGRISVFELAATVAANVFVIVALVWQQVAAPIVIEGTGFPLFDPELWSSWLPWFIALAALEIVLAVAIYARGRWTWPFAIANAGLNAAFAIPALWLLQGGRLFNPALIAEVEEVAGGAWFAPTAAAIAVLVGVITAWDAIDGFRKAWRSSGGGPGAIVGAAIGRS